jgi:hypothetical protein
LTFARAALSPTDSSPDRVDGGQSTHP